MAYSESIRCYWTTIKDENGDILDRHLIKEISAGPTMFIRANLSTGKVVTHVKRD